MMRYGIFSMRWASVSRGSVSSSGNSCYQLRQIRQTIQSLTCTSDAAMTIVPAFIACRLDWCNLLLYDVLETLLRKVQSVQNAATCLLTNIGRRDHTTPVLRQRRQSSKAPTYFTADIRVVSEHGRRSLRFTSNRTLAVLWTRGSFGDKSFATSGPRLWNRLPANLRQMTSYGQFRRHVKSILFRGFTSLSCTTFEIIPLFNTTVVMCTFRFICKYIVVNACYLFLISWEIERFRTANVTFKVTQVQWYWCHPKSMRFVATSCANVIGWIFFSNCFEWLSFAWQIAPLFVIYGLKTW